MIHQATVKGYAGIGLLDIMPGSASETETLAKVVIAILAAVPSIKEILKSVVSLFKKRKA